MSIWLILLMASDLVPLFRAIWANRRTPLLHALVWGLAAWAAWLWLAVSPHSAASYIATSLTACAGVAVLGARRPGVGAWNAVVAGLLATLLVPLAQDFLTGNSWLHSDPWFVFRGLLSAVVILNFGASRAAIGAFSLGLACVFAMIAADDRRSLLQWTIILAGMAPWLAWLPFLRRRQSSDEFDQMWFSFRDRFGLMWSLRVQEQFRNAAKNNGLAIDLNSRGLKRVDGGVPEEAARAAAQELLAALLKRFGPS